MKKEWENVIIERVEAAVHVPAGAGKAIHDIRPFHGFVIDEDDALKEYVFSDGRVMRTEGGCFFYLPKGSSYYVKTIKYGGCYAINFDADIEDKPFAIKLKDRDGILKNFKTAADGWKKQSPLWRAAAMRALYDAIYRARREGENYMPTDTVGHIRPAVDAMDSEFTDNALTVASLAERCGVSEVYFRRIFADRFGVSPKEYIIRKRIEYAKQLLCSGQFPVSEVALMCGYAEPCHFTREFSRRVGIAPGGYSAGVREKD